MKTDSGGETGINSSREKASSSGLDLLRIVALIVVVAGTVCSEILIIRAGGRSQPLLTVVFVVWILLPFVALAWANVVSKSWPNLTRVALYLTTFVVTVSCLAFYGGLILPPTGSPRAFVFVVGPLASWALMLIVVPIASAISRMQ